MRKRGAIRAAALGTAVIAALAVTGCAARKQPKTQAQTQIQTQTQPQAQTEKKLSLKDIQVSVPRSSRTGSAAFSVTTDTGTSQGSGNFESTVNAMSFSSDLGSIYSGSDMTACDTGTGYKCFSFEFNDLFGFLYSSSCTLEEDTQVDETACWHIRFDGDEETGEISALAVLAGYSDVMTGSLDIDYYVSKQNFDIVKTDVSTVFMGTGADGSSFQGQISASFTGTASESVQIIAPQIAEEKETEETESYEPGTVNSATNSYKSQTFGIQIVGGSLFSFNEEKTNEYRNTYVSNSSPYTEEAYGESADGVIVNAQSIPSGEGTNESILSDYLTLAGAQSVQSGGTFDAAGLSFVKASSTINGRLAVTYCGISGDRALVITLYSDNADNQTKFESCFYSITEDPFWTAQTWTVMNRYRVMTPRGYTIARNASKSIYAVMEGPDSSITVFAKNGSSIEAEISNEQESSGGVTKEPGIQENVTLADGSNMTFLTVKCTEADLEYWTHIGLYQKNEMVFECYCIKSEEDTSLKDVFSDIANNTVDDGQVESQTSEAETSQDTWQQDGAGS